VRLSPGTPGERRDASEATPVNFEASKRAIAPLSPSVPSYFPADVSSFLASLPSARFSLSATETDMFLSRPPLSFHGYTVYPSDVFFSLSLSRLSAFPSTITPLERRSLGDPSICSAWQSTTATHCHRTISTPRLVYTAAV